MLWTINQLIGPGPVRLQTPSAQAVLCYQPCANRWVLHVLTAGQLSVALDAKRIPVKRISARYPAVGWKAEIQVGWDSHQIKVSEGAENRLLVLEA